MNSGTSCYGENEKRRQYERSTIAHNTVCVDGLDSSEVWKIFRVGRHAKQSKLVVNTTDANALWLGSGHDGYLNRGATSCYHERNTKFSRNTLQITDKLQGSFRLPKAISICVPDGLGFRLTAKK